jgi:hypothetical protein
LPGTAASAGFFYDMAEYRPVLCSFWTDPDTEEWKPNERLVYLFLCTNKEARESGIYQISQKYISERTNITIDKIKEIIITLSSVYNKITYDNNTFFVHGFMRRNFKGNPALLEKSILKDFENSPSFICWSRFCEIYKTHFISKKIKELLNTCQSVIDTSMTMNMKIDMTMNNDNDNRNDNEIINNKNLEQEKSKDEIIFEACRKAYPGSKRGLDTEFENLKKKHDDYKGVLPLLEQALSNQKQWRVEMTTAGMFIPEWPGLAVWINQRRWENEKPVIEIKNKKDTTESIDEFQRKRREQFLSGGSQ